jgi:hypothetical protein
MRGLAVLNGYGRFPGCARRLPFVPTPTPTDWRTHSQDSFLAIRVDLAKPLRWRTVKESRIARNDLRQVHKLNPDAGGQLRAVIQGPDRPAVLERKSEARTGLHGA